MDWLIWIGIALVLAAAEVASLSLVCIMLAGGAVIAALASAVGLSLWVQVLAFGVVSALLLVFVRKSALTRWAPKGKPVGVAADIGRIGIVVETVTQYDGRIKLPGDAIWSARLAPSDDPPSSPGEPVQIIRIEGATAIVARPRQEPSS